MLDAIVVMAARLCQAEFSILFNVDGPQATVAAINNAKTNFIAYLREHPVPIARSSITGRAALERQTVHVVDVLADPEYRRQGAQQFGGQRTILSVPLLRDGEPIGVITMMRSAVRAFSDQHIALVETFADQAVIAINNARLFAEIQEKSRQLQIASQHKSQFLANMSHELRTPLNAILGYTELIQDGIYGDAPAKIKGVVERVTTNGKHLLGLINDVLDFSKIEAGQLKLQFADYSVKHLVQTVATATEPLASAKKLGFAIDVANNLPTGRADERRLAQVLLNLVGNAIKFTEAGGITIAAAVEGANFHLRVIDTGPGIAASDQVRIFEQFQQIDSTSTRTKGGTGLGLAITKQFVELHGGRIWVEFHGGPGRDVSCRAANSVP